MVSISSGSMAASVRYFPAHIYNGCARVNQSIVNIAKRVFAALAVVFRAIGSGISRGYAWLKAKVSKKTPVQTSNTKRLNAYLASMQSRFNLSDNAMIRIKKNLDHVGKTPYDGMTSKEIVDQITQKVTIQYVTSQGKPVDALKSQKFADVLGTCVQVYDHWLKQFTLLGLSDEKACMLAASIVTEIMIQFMDAMPQGYTPSK